MNRKLIIPASLVLVFSSCKESTDNNVDTAILAPVETVSAIQPPVQNVEVDKQYFTINSIENQKVNLANGGSIEFDANSFVDEEGNLVEGEVTIEYQEFHTLTDIILSGIPMDYDSAGVVNNFISAGMFTMDGKSKGKQVNIAPDKEVKVNMASYVDTPCYNFYELDEKSGKWSYETTKAAEKMPDIKEQDNIMFIDVEADYRHLSSLENETVIGWYIDENMQQLTSTEKEMLTKKSFSKIEVNQEGEDYVMDLPINSDSKNIKVKPYFITDLNGGNQLSESAQSQIARKLAFQEKGRRGKVIRTIAIQGFGTFNWDIVNKRENSQILAAKFNVVEEDIANAQVILVSPEENAMVNYPKEGSKLFSFDPNKKAILVSIYDGNKISIADNNQFVKAKNMEAGSEVEFVFVDTGIEIKAGQDLSNLLANYF